MKIIHAHHDTTPAFHAYLRESLPAAFWREAKAESRERFLSPRPLASIVLARVRYYRRRYEIHPFYENDGTVSLIVRRIPRRKSAAIWEFVRQNVLWPGNWLIAERVAGSDEASEAWGKLAVA